MDGVVHFLAMTSKAQYPMLTNCSQCVRGKGWWRCVAIFYLLPRHCLCNTDSRTTFKLRCAFNLLSDARIRPRYGSNTYLHTVCTSHAKSFALAVHHKHTSGCRRCRLHVHAALAAYLCQESVCCATAHFLQDSMIITSAYFTYAEHMSRQGYRHRKPSTQ